MPAGSFVQTLKRCHQIKCVVCKVCLLDLISDKVGKGQRGENDLHVLGAESATNRHGPEKHPPPPSALAFFALLQIKSEIPRLGLSYPRSYHCINFTPYHSFRGRKKTALLRDSLERDHSTICVFLICVFCRIVW